QVGAVVERLGVLRDDDPFLGRPEILVAFPAFEVLAVEELDLLALPLARRHLGGGLVLVGRHRIAPDQGEQRHGRQAKRDEQRTSHASSPLMRFKLGDGTQTITNAPWTQRSRRLRMPWSR